MKKRESLFFMAVAVAQVGSVHGVGPMLLQEAYLKASNTEPGDRFGWAVSISGDTAVVGAPYEDSAGGEGDNSLNWAGAAYVFVRQGGVWTQQAYLKPAHPGEEDVFGYSVAIDGDTIVVGAGGEDGSAGGVNGDQMNDAAPSAGAAFVFVRVGGVWTQQAYLKAGVPEEGDEFGRSVSVSGDTVVVGAPQEDAAGGAYVFARSGGVWTQEGHLQAGNAGVGDRFGWSVDVDADRVVVGAVEDDSAAVGVDGDATDNSAENAGSAFVFERTGGVWTQAAYLKASNAGAGDKFGYAVSISGGSVLVTAPWEDSGSTSINGDQIDNSVTNAGAGYVFTLNGAVWLQEAYLKQGNPGGGDRMGYAADLRGDTAAIGAPFEDGAGTGINPDGSDNSAAESGTVYVFVRTTNYWSRQAYVKGPVVGEGDYIGYAVALDGGSLCVGAPYESSAATGVDGNAADNSATFAGAAFAFVGFGPEPGPRLLVEHPSGSQLDSGDALLKFRVTQLGTSATRRLTLRNVGDTLLTGLTLQLGPSGAGGFSVGDLAATTLAPGAVMEVDVTFVAAAEGVSTAQLEIGSDDARGPFLLNLEGAFQVTTSFGGGAVEIRESGPANPHPSEVLVSGITGEVLGMRVRLTGLSHGWPDDLDVFLSGPAGQVCALFSDAGGGVGVSDVDLTFGDDGVSGLPDGPTMVSGTWLPEGHGEAEPLPPKTLGPIRTRMADMAAAGVNGVWKLWINDDGAGDAGSLEGWVIEVETAEGGGDAKLVVLEEGDLPLRDGAGPLAMDYESAPVTRSFTLRNVGSAALNGLEVALDGPQAEDFSLTEPGESVVPPGGELSFHVQFEPAGTGAREASVVITSDDLMEPFVLHLEGGRVFAPLEFTANGILSVPGGPSMGPASEYPSILQVTGVTAAVVGIEVRLDGFSHAWPDDVDVFLVAPDGSACVLMSDAGGGTPVSGVTLAFSDVADGPVPDSSALLTGSYLPSNHLLEESAPPGSVGGAGTSLAALVAGGVNGLWRLYVSDDTDGDGGSMMGWSLIIHTDDGLAEPEILITTETGVPLAALGNDLDVGTAVAGDGLTTTTFRIANTGTANLALGGAMIAFAAHPEFTVSTALMPALLTPGQSTSLPLQFSPSMSGLRTTMLSVSSDDADEGLLSITLRGTGIAPRSVFDAAVEAAGLSGLEAAPEAVPFFEGVPNVLKYAFNLNLAEADSTPLVPLSGVAGLPSITMSPSGLGMVMRFEFVRRVGAGLVYTPVIRFDLDALPWVPLTDEPEEIPLGDGWSRVIYEEPLDPQVTPIVFGRVEVTLP